MLISDELLDITRCEKQAYFKENKGKFKEENAMKRKMTTLMAVLAASACVMPMNVLAEEKVSFTIFNSKTELQADLEEAAAAYSAENNVDIEVYFSNDTVAAHLATRYSSGSPYTLTMTDAKDIYSVGAIYGYDMSEQDWVKDTDYAITVDGKVIGFPFCVEARGLLYNADAIEAVTGESFDPSSIVTTADFEAFCEKLVEGGMEYPTSILKPDWSLGAHFIQQTYEEREDVEGFVQALYAGTADLGNDERFNSLMNTFDVLKKYNYFQNNAVGVSDEEVHLAMSEGEVAFQFGGCWEWNDIIDYDYTGNVGMMALPQDLQDEYAGCLVGGGSKYFYIDNSEHTTDEQRQAASDFLNWLAYSDEGKTLVADTCALVSPFKNNEVPCANELGGFVKQYMDDGKMVANYDYDPDDHYSVVGAKMQEYLGDQIDRTELAKRIEEYWASTTPVEH